MTDAIQTKILEEITTLIQTDQLVLPTLPEVALKAREVAEDPDVSSSKLSAVLQNDPALSARVIKVANSPLLRATRVVDDLITAINRLGIIFTANLVTGLAMEQMFQATSEVVDIKLRDIWAKSTITADKAHVLCRHFTELSPDQATLSGLIHELGALPVLTYTEEQLEMIPDPNVLDDIIEQLHPKLGSLILRNWDFPQEIIAVPEGMADITHDDGLPASYVDLVIVANLHSTPSDDLDLDTIPAFKKLGLGTEAERKVLDDLNEEISETISLLQ